ncbi:oligosaccharide flippase family protein [Methylosinus sp. H3A]|uniref:lipopolysaccharide biosynthesis protein n=1 Tax=Methylosinus sp. H3A TaxID=2785786 RepID=UPI0018C2BFBE|nr:polysaccharide biosynthesis C-terminal domain-containing protein [Methylosinus sp. H3A]MBG0810507.1 oligosaccharide flippase family protein [Methylosinus sp. H3A]
MLARQTVVYFAANVFSAIFGLLNTIVFTRVFAVAAYGDYLLGFAFATLLATFLASALKLAILREQAKGDGADIRGAILAAMALFAPMAPLFFMAARLTGLSTPVAAASVLLAFAVTLYETSQESLRAAQRPLDYLRGTVYRALLVSALGVGVALASASGAALLASSSAALVVATALFWRAAWGDARPRLDRARLLDIAKAGLPFTFSMSLMALATVADRFLLAELAGVADAGRYGASLDLVRQALIIPAISVSTAFVPMAVRLFAERGEAEARRHLAKSAELLLAVALPACVGFALVSPQIADLVLGPEFRETGRWAMPILAMAVVFQILTQQYLHTSFLLSNRNSFYLVNTGSILVFNLIVSALLIYRFGLAGAVWGRLAAEMFGCAQAYALSRIAFAMPLPLGRIALVGAATAAMALAVHAFSSEAATLPPALALALLVSAGVGVYAPIAFALDLAEMRGLVGGLARRRGARACQSPVG